MVEGLHGAGQPQRQLLRPAGDMDVPARVAPVALELADDRLGGEGGEGDAIGRVEAIRGLHQPDHRRLHEVLVRSLRAREATDEVMGKRHVVFHEASPIKAGVVPDLRPPRRIRRPAQLGLLPAFASSTPPSGPIPAPRLPLGYSGPTAAALYASRLAAGREMVALSPEEIENKQFPAVVRGYDRSAVDDFLRQVADEVRRLQAAAARAAAQPAPAPAPARAPEATAEAPPAADPYET